MDKEQLAKYLSELDENVLKVAIMYSINYLAYGVDVTEKWNTATQQQDALYRAKCDGYYEGRSSIVRCKDCKHRPKKPDWETYEDGSDIEFPDGKCPCQCSSDRYYSWYPDDDWFCADGRRRDE